MHVSVTYYAGIASRFQKVFLQFYLKKKFEYLLETKVSNRLLLVLGVISPRAKRPLFFFDIWFLLLTCVILSKFSGFEVSRGRIFCLILGEFRDNFLFF